MPGYTIDILASSNLNKGHHPSLPSFSFNRSSCIFHSTGKLPLQSH